jgi:CHAT domain
MFDFEIEISGERGRYWVAARSDDGETGAVAVVFPFDDQALSRHQQALEWALLHSAATGRRLPVDDEKEVQKFGGPLFEFAFPPEVRAHLSLGRQRAAQEGTRLGVRLRVGPPELAVLPWEFLYDPDRDDYLCLSTPLVRYLDVREPRRALTVAPPLRILGMVAHPHDQDSLNIDHEQRRLRQALAGLEHSGRVQLSWVTGQTWWDLQEALDHDRWHVLHFIGHGGFDRDSGEGLLVLASEDGGTYRFGASNLALLLGEHHSLRLVVLNSCDSARSSAAEVFSSTAAVLMRRGIPAVVAMQYEISDEGAITFARGFYTAIAGRVITTVVRREALTVRVEVRVLRRSAVVAVG